MPSNNDSNVSAEQQFRAAFERLKAQKPLRLGSSSPVTQNNVAKEAGKDPSALRKSRYPTLIAEIQRWVEHHSDEKPPSPRQKTLAQRRRNRSLREQIETIKAERDIVVSQLLAAHTKILDLTAQIIDLGGKQPPSNVVPLHSRTPKSGP